MDDKPSHIVLLNQPFHPDVVATAQMGKDLADHLINQGFTVSAIASRSIYGSTGATLPKHEVIDNITIHRVGSNIFGKKGIIARLADFALFYLQAGFKITTMKKPTVVVSFTTPPFIALLGLWCRLARGSKAVYWVMDLYPDVPVACSVMSPRSPLTKLMEHIHRWILKKSDAVVVLGRCMKNRVIDKGIPESRIHFIPVWPIDAGLKPVTHESNSLRKKWNPDNQTCVMYSGNFGIAHDADTLMNAMIKLRDDNSIRFDFIGSGKRRALVEQTIKDSHLINAAWHEYVPREQLAHSLSAGDIHIVSIKEGLEGLIVPSKMFGIMSVGRPVIYIGNRQSEIARIISESGCGLLVSQGDDAALVDAIQTLAKNPAKRQLMGQAGKDALKGIYDKHSACQAWSELLTRLTGSASVEPEGVTP